MTRPSGAHARDSLSFGVRLWCNAVSSGTFLTGWTALASLLLATTILGPYHRVGALAEIPLGFGVGLAGWLVLAAAMIPVAVAERRLHSPVARGVLVVSAILAASVARPFLNDAIATALGDLALHQNLAERVATNLVAWLPVLSLVGITTVRYGSTTRTRARLAAALTSLSEGKRRLRRYERDGRELVIRSVADLRTRRDELLTLSVDFDAVRDFADAVRSVSHRLMEQSRVQLQSVIPDAVEQRSAHPGLSSFLARLRPPPVLLVGAFYLAGTVPYVSLVGGWPLLLANAAVGLGLALAADIATRTLAPHLHVRARGVALIAVWAGAGVAITAIGAVIMPDAGLVLLIPVIAVPALAVVCALCTDAVHRAAIRATRLSTVLTMVARSLAAHTAQARAPLTRAADTLHGRVQGRCVIFAAYLDEHEPTEAALEKFRVETDRALDEVIAALDNDTTPRTETLADLINAWSGVVNVDVEVSPAASSALADDEVARRAAEMANEALVNAVKHSTARTARLTVDATEESVRMRVANPGRLLPRLERTPGLGIAGLGDSARLIQEGPEVVLETSIPRPGLQDDVTEQPRATVA